MSDRIRAALAQAGGSTRESPELTASAVLVPLFGADDAVSTLFIRRSMTVATHKGQYCFPGGKAEPEDANLCATALRETQEELGLDPRGISILGELDDVRTPFAMRISPYVGWLSAPRRYIPCPDEVDIVVEVPLARLCEPGIRTRERRVSADGQAWDLSYYRFDGHVVWGATGRILDDLLGRLGWLPLP